MSSSKSAFSRRGFQESIAQRKQEIQNLYLSDSVPWVLGYSGGKDSTAALQLLWLAIKELNEEQRSKPIHVISTDTLVENPIVAAWVESSLLVMKKAAAQQSMPINPHRLVPRTTESFWVNLIGKGYPAPRNKFRWCTERLKIQPSNDFIREVVRANGEAILILGTRTAESSKRAASIAKHGKKAVSTRLTPSSSLQNCLVFTPIEDWTNDDVWLFVNQLKNPWGFNNKELLAMYRGASADGECPLVVDTGTPSCGNSRFGCWVCTLVDEDKSMGAMIQNDDEKEWMLPLLEFRNELDFRTDEARKRDRKNREYRRITGHLTYYTNKDGEGKLVPGPYKQEARARYLRRILEIQKWIQANGPKYVRDLSLITDEELREIRRIWLSDKHEVEDLAPRIYREATGKAFPGDEEDQIPALSADALSILREVCGEDDLHYEMIRNLLATIQKYDSRSLRRGLYHELENQIKRCFFKDEGDALRVATDKNAIKQAQYVSEDGTQSQRAHALRVKIAKR